VELLRDFSENVFPGFDKALLHRPLVVIYDDHVQFDIAVLDICNGGALLNQVFADCSNPVNNYCHKSLALELPRKCLDMVVENLVQVDWDVAL
jgi:hypothetical protein